MGARRIVITGLPPIGCLPAERTLGGGIQRDCVSLYNQAAQEYNAQLSRKVQVLQKSHQEATIIYADIYEKLLRFIRHPSDYGKLMIIIRNTLE